MAYVIPIGLIFMFIIFMKLFLSTSNPVQRKMSEAIISLQKGMGSLGGYMFVGRQPKNQSKCPSKIQPDPYYQSWGYDDGVTVDGTESDDDGSLIMKSDSEEDERPNPSDDTHSIRSMHTAVTVHCGESDESADDNAHDAMGGYHGIDLKAQCKD